LRSYLSLVLLFLCTFTAQSSPFVQTSTEQKIDVLLQEADRIKYQNDSLGLLKIKEAQKLALQLKSNQKLGEVYTMFGIYYYIAGTYDLSLQMYLDAIAIHEKYDNEKDIARSLNGVALIQSAFNQLEDALKTLQKCLALELKNNNFDGIARSYFNIGVTQIDLKQYEQATLNFKKSLLFSRKNNKNQVNHMVENRLGDMMLIKNDTDSAFYYYNTVINDLKNKPNNWENAYAYAGLANVYLVIEDYDKAEKNGLLSYDYALKINAKWDQARIVKMLSEIYKKQGNSGKAYEYLLLNNFLKESIYSEQKLNDINYVQLKSKEVENLKLITKDEINVQKAKRDRIIIYSFLALTIFLLGIVFLIRRNARIKDVFNKELNIKNKNIEGQKVLITAQNKELISLNEIKNKLFSIISHDLRSPIANIVQILELQKDNALSAEMQEEIFEKLHLQTQATSKMLNNLLDWANTQMDGQTVNFETIDLYKISKSVIEFYFLEINKKNIICTNQVPSKVYLIKADEGQVRVIIQNLLANAIKFTTEKGKISFRYSESETFVNLHITNSGASIEQKRINEILNSTTRIQSQLGTSAEEGTGLGLLLVKQFLANNKGMLDIKTSATEGTEFVISFLKNVE
jgi:signal transduction histidine kinase